MHKIKIESGMSQCSTNIWLDEQTFDGVKSLDVRMRVGEVNIVTAEIIPQISQIEFMAADVFIVIGQKKYRLMECVAECNHEFTEKTVFGSAVKMEKCIKCGIERKLPWDGDVECMQDS